MSTITSPVLTDSTGQNIVTGIQNIVTKLDGLHVTATNVSYDNSLSSLSATNVQNAVDELVSELDGETSTVTGDIVTFETESAQVLPSVVVDIDPVQDLHGYDHPWPAGGGKNLADPDKVYLMSIGAAPQRWEYIDNPDGIYRTLKVDQLKAGTYTISTTLNNNYFIRYRYTVNGSVVGANIQSSANNYTFTLTDDVTDFGISIRNTSSTAITESFVVQLESGSTATSFAPYSNICPISGWEDCQVWVSPTPNPADGTTYQTVFGNPPGTVYGGELNLETGVLTVTMAYDKFDGTETWNLSTYNRFYFKCNAFVKSFDYQGKISCDKLPTSVSSSHLSLEKNGVTGYRDSNQAYPGKNWIYVKVDGVTTLSDYLAWLSANTLTVVYELATPVTYQLTPTQVTALLGQNNLWADTGDSTVIYRTGKVALLSDIANSEGTAQASLERLSDDLNDKIDSLTASDVGAANDSSIATVEPTSTASVAHAVGSHLMLGGVLYEVTSAIASGETITQGTNVTPVTVMESMAAMDTRLSANIQLASEAVSIGIPYEGVDLTVKFAAEIAQYTDPWAWIKARISAGDWSGLRIGDYIPFTTTESSPKTYQAQIAGINTYKNYGDTAVGNHIDFICRELWATRHPMNPVNFNNGTKFGDAAATEYPWLASDLYLYLNSLAGKVPNATTAGGGTGTDVDYTSGGVYYYLPSALKAQIVEKRAYQPKRYNASSVLTDDNAAGWTNIGKLWLPSEFEVYGVPVWGGNGGFSTMGDCVQYPIFTHNMNRVKFRNNNLNIWWVLSACSGNTERWCYVSADGVAYSGNASGTSVAIPICFRIA